MSTIYRYKKFEDMSNEEKMLGCFQHVILCYVLQETANNESLRKRFGVAQEKNYLISKLVLKAIESNLIKRFDQTSNSRKFIKYVPYNT